MNNFDQSSTGVNLSLYCFWDTGLSQMWFNDTMTNLHYNDFSMLKANYCSVNLYLYTSYSEFTDNFDLLDLSNYDLKSVTKKQLLTSISSSFYDSSDYLKEDSFHYFEKYPYQLTKLELFELVENAFPYDYQDFIKNNLTPLFTVLPTRGHCQGDYAEVLIPEVLTKEQEKSYQNEIDNIFWNTPLSCTLVIEEEDFNFDSYLNDVYYYDKKELLTIAEKEITHEKKDLIISFLSDNLPEYPETL